MTEYYYDLRFPPNQILCLYYDFLLCCAFPGTSSIPVCLFGCLHEWFWFISNTCRVVDFFIVLSAASDNLWDEFSFIFFFSQNSHLGAYISGFCVFRLFSWIVVQGLWESPWEFLLSFWVLLLCYPECHIILLSLHPHFDRFLGKVWKSKFFIVGWEITSCLFKAYVIDFSGLCQDRCQSEFKLPVSRFPLYFTHLREFKIPIVLYLL